MTEALDKVLAAVDLHDRAYKLAQSWGATEELAEVFATSQKEKFKWDGVNLIWNASGKPAVDGDDCKAHFTQGALAALFPKAETKGPDVDAVTLESARAGNMTAYSRIVREHGKATADTLLAQKKSDTAAQVDAPVTKEKPTNNPWSAGSWSVTAQGRVYKTDPALAARLAKAANSHIGATKPSKAA
jgi:hypothetical protein